MPNQEQWLLRQLSLADFGEFAIRSEELDEVLTEACRLVAEALGTGRAKVLEIQEGGRELLVRAGVGWAPDVVGHVRLQMSERSSESYSINAAKPVVSQDIAKETRFDIPEFMKKAGVSALVNVPIFVPGRRPYGILQVDSTRPREFGPDEIQFLRTYAMILGPVIDRLLIVQDSEAIRLIADAIRREANASDKLLQSTWETDADGIVISDSPSWRAYTGQTLDEWLGHRWLDAIHPDDQAYAERQWCEAVAARKLVNAEFRVRVAGGEWRWTNVRAAPVVDGEGRIEKWVGMNIDVDDRKRAENALRSSEELRRVALDGGGMGAWRWDTRDGSVIADETFQALWGIPVSTMPHPFTTYTDRMDADGAASLFSVMTEGVAPGVKLQNQVQVTNGPAAGRWLQWRGRASEEEPWLINGVSFDITELKQLEARQQVLVAELQHRTRNIMAVVRSMADKTARASTDLADFRDRFRGRLEALSRVQGLLSRLNEHDRVTFDELVETELSVMGDGPGRVRLDGPKGVRLRSSMVQMLAMALHELATNATKYGALGQAGAHLDVTWAINCDERDKEPRLHIDWRESGVEMPPAGSGPSGGGQGRELIEKALPYQLSARTTYELGPDGVHCTLSIPISTTLAKGAAHA